MISRIERSKKKMKTKYDKLNGTDKNAICSIVHSMLRIPHTTHCNSYWINVIYSMLVYCCIQTQRDPTPKYIQAIIHRNHKYISFHFIHSFVHLVRFRPISVLVFPILHWLSVGIANINYKYMYNIRFIFRCRPYIRFHRIGYYTWLYAQHSTVHRMHAKSTIGYFSK